MKRCTSCGYELPDEAVFCLSCGTKIEEIPVVTVENPPAVDELNMLCTVQDLYGKAYDLRMRLHDMESKTYPYDCPKVPQYIEPKLISIPEFQPVDLEPMPAVAPSKDQITPRPVKQPPMRSMLQSRGFIGWGIATISVFILFVFNGDVFVRFVLSPLFIIFLVVWILVSMSDFKKIKQYRTIYDNAVRQEYDFAYKRAVSHIQTSPEYSELCKPIKERNELKIKIQKTKYEKTYEDSIRTNEMRKKEADSAHQQRINQYYDVTLPKYQLDLAEWQDNYNAQKKNLTSEYHSTVHDISTMLDNCGAIPSDYYDIEHINELVSIMQSSHYTIKEAIEIYDRRRQRELMDKLIIAKNREAQQLFEQNNLLNERNQLLYDQNQIAEAQAYLAAEANDIAEEARRDAIITITNKNIMRNCFVILRLSSHL